MNIITKFCVYPLDFIKAQLNVIHKRVLFIVIACFNYMCRYIWKNITKLYVDKGIVISISKSPLKKEFLDLFKKKSFICWEGDDLYIIVFVYFLILIVIWMQILRNIGNKKSINKFYSYLLISLNYLSNWFTEIFLVRILRRIMNQKQTKKWKTGV